MASRKRLTDHAHCSQLQDQVARCTDQVEHGQHWARDAQVPNAPSLLWLFPPFPLIGAVVNKLLLEQVDAILVLPMHLKFWVPMLQRLPIVDSHVLGFHKGLYKLGSKVPPFWHHNMPRISLKAYLVRFRL